MPSHADRKASAAARHRLLPGGRLAGPMPWIIAIMMFLTVLAAAAGLGLGAAVRSMSADLAGRASVQVVEADAQVRAQLAARTLTALRSSNSVRAADPVDPAALADQLRPWLGDAATSGDLPVPALIDVMLTPGDAEAKIGSLRRLLANLSPKLRIEPHAAFLLPLAGLMSALGWLSAGVVLLMILATGAVVVLAARGAHDSHRGTIDVLHLMGSTDVQIARLFQRRIGLDALMGSALGFSFAAFVILLIGLRLAATGSDLIGAVELDMRGWLILVALPIFGVVLATLAARWTVLRALGRAL
ncbi:MULTISPECIES: cell division protein FtsX [Sphingobium]|jgi:cell division transport system permease protein|uniref:cell division protein FtsX n=1 Tax=Sphingobium TaxID=165695 RepID=UPI000DBB7BCB|nr:MULTISPECIES: cell division protein [Sphingobium]KAA9014799.1 cell division protein [Sphingobium limneticum]MBU0930822.1 cell division protein [Alphaproteobacteria bacterium]BBD01023.1 cell division transport system permease protein [Sphingobium sp. YG1]